MTTAKMIRSPSPFHVSVLLLTTCTRINASTVKMIPPNRPSSSWLLRGRAGSLRVVDENSSYACSNATVQLNTTVGQDHHVS